MEIGAEAALFPEKKYISRIFVAVLILQDMRVESGGSCVLVESEAIGQEAVFCRM